MKVTDIIFALIFGRMLGFLIEDFLREGGIKIGFYYILIFWIALPFFSLFCLWLAYLIGKKWLFIFQAAKFLLVGAFATIIDLKIFELLTLLLIPIPLISKSISFLVATFLKYWGNKYWTFGKYEGEDINKEIIQFFIITSVGLIVDVASFYYFTKIMGPQFAISSAIWIKLSVIFAAITAALWNFLGYKFLVFKK